METRLEIVKQQIEALCSAKKHVIIAIDGNCTSGKTTLASQLAASYDCNVFHMDDFFLRPQQRTPERYAQPGGNVDYERFREEVLLPLSAGEDFSYQPFACKTFTLTAPVQVPVKKINIIEGSYSLHPYFGEPYDLKILLTVDPQLQMQRILLRPAHLHKQFAEQWIPMENRYLEELRIADRADLIL